MSVASDDAQARRRSAQRAAEWGRKDPTIADVIAEIRKLPPEEQDEAVRQIKEAMRLGNVEAIKQSRRALQCVRSLRGGR